MGFVNDANGNQITINLYNDFDVVIDVNALFQRKKTVENWQCLTDCTLLYITFDGFSGTVPFAIWIQGMGTHLDG